MKSTTQNNCLIITYYWPPAGGPGVQRWLKFCTYLPKYGVQPIVYIPKNPNYPTIDNNLLSEVPENISIIQHPITEPYRWAAIFSKKTKTLSQGIISEKNITFPERILLWVRGNLFIPDARKSWVKPSVKVLKQYILKHHIDTVITTGPPHSLHLIGKALKDSLNIRWIADFRDPWTTISYHRKLKLTPYAHRKHLHLESLILKECSHIIVTSNLTKKEFSQKTTTPISVITNGYEPYISETLNLTGNFTLTHAGTLLTERNPCMLWEVLSELCTEVESFANDLEIRLAGRISQSLLDDLERNNLMTHTLLLGYIPHDEVRRLQNRSQILLLIEANTEDTRAIIPGKLFEYLCAKRPIVAIGPASWEVLEILEKTKSGNGFNYSEKSALKRHLKDLYVQFKNGCLYTNSRGIEAYTREALTKKLSEIILD